MVTTKNENVHFQINPGYKADAMEIDMEPAAYMRAFKDLFVNTLNSSVAQVLIPLFHGEYQAR